MGMRGFDRVLVEPSGIFDVEEFFDVLHEEPLTNWYEIGNVFAIVDASLEKNLSKEASYLLASQIVSAGKIILSKVDFPAPFSPKRACTSPFCNSKLTFFKTCTPPNDLQIFSSETAHVFSIFYSYVKIIEFWWHT